jgi:hypothetical protein
MHARMTRYEGAAPEALEDTLRTKKGILPTEFGQTEGMKGAIFLIDRRSGTVVSSSPCGRTRTRCRRARTRRLASARK